METAQADFDWDNFSAGFWHPFGPHGGERPEEILQRKANEIAINGWTLWSFRSRSVDPTADLTRWSRAIQVEGKAKVFALCANSRTGNSKEPASIAVPAKSFKSLDDKEWLPISDGIKVPHHFGEKTAACAFKVKAIHIFPASEDQPRVGIEWLNSAGIWRSDIFPNGLHYPNRGEYLIRRNLNAQTHLRPVKAALELEYPYVVMLRK